MKNIIFNKSIKSKLIKNQNVIFSYIKGYLKKHPYFCVIILHEYFRNLEPHDPYVKFKIINPKNRINNLQLNLIKILKNFKNIGFYKNNFKISNLKEELKKKNWKSLW